MKLSIIICTYNRAQYINNALKSLKNQTLNEKLYEIIVVNNNSTDHTEQVVKDFQKEHKILNFKYVIESNQGLSFARNKGIKVATGDYISFIDDDAVANEHFAEYIIEAFENYSEYIALGGKVIPVYEEGNEPLWMSKYIERLVSKVDYGDKIKEFKSKYPVGCNMAFRKDVFNKIGGFNTSLNLRADDKYVFYKIKKAKLKVLYFPDAVVMHNIEKERTTEKFIIRLSRLNGRSERIRLNTDSKVKSFFHSFIFILKIFASYLLFLKFLLNKEVIKGKYLVKVMLNTFYGYIFYNKVTEYKK